MIQPDVLVKKTDLRDNLEVFDGLPPLAAFLGRKSPDEWERLRIVQAHFGALKAGIAAYFAGQAYDFGADEKLMKAEMDYYLRLYHLIWMGWKEIVAELNKPMYAIGDADQTGEELSPGGLLRIALEAQCEGMQRLFKVSRKDSREILLKGRPTLPPTDSRSVKDVKRVIAYGDKVLSRAATDEALVQFIDRAIKNRLRGNPTLKAARDDFRAAMKRRHQTIARLSKKKREN